MATKSFTTEFKFNKRSAQNLMNAIESSNIKNKKHVINQKVNDVTDKQKIDNILESFLKED